MANKVTATLTEIDETTGETLRTESFEKFVFAGEEPSKETLTIVMTTKDLAQGLAFAATILNQVGGK